MPGHGQPVCQLEPEVHQRESRQVNIPPQPCRGPSQRREDAFCLLKWNLHLHAIEDLATQLPLGELVTDPIVPWLRNQEDRVGD